MRIVTATLLIGILAAASPGLEAQAPPHHEGGEVQHGYAPPDAPRRWTVARHPQPASPSSARSIRAGAASAARLLLGPGPLRVAWNMAVGAGDMGDIAAGLRLGTRALAVVPLRVGVARRLLGVLSRISRADCRTQSAHGARISFERRNHVSPVAPVAQVDRAAVS